MYMEIDNKVSEHLGNARAKIKTGFRESAGEKDNSRIRLAHRSLGY